MSEHITSFDEQYPQNPREVYSPWEPEFYECGEGETDYEPEDEETKGLGFSFCPRGCGLHFDNSKEFCWDCGHQQKFEPEEEQPMAQFQKEWLDNIETVHDMDKENYQQIENPDITASSDKGLKVDGVWLPKSQMRVDFEGEIYLAHWLYKKQFGG